MEKTAQYNGSRPGSTSGTAPHAQPVTTAGLATGEDESKTATLPSRKEQTFSIKLNNNRCELVVPEQVISTDTRAIYLIEATPPDKARGGHWQIKSLEPNGISLEFCRRNSFFKYIYDKTRLLGQFVLGRPITLNSKPIDVNEGDRLLVKDSSGKLIAKLRFDCTNRHFSFTQLADTSELYERLPEIPSKR